MSIITNLTMQVLWNGVPTKKFRPIRGVRQGCPHHPICSSYAWNV